MVVVVGISFNLIIIRVHEGLALTGSDNSDTLPLKFITQPTLATGIATGVEVAISREVEHQVSDFNDVFKPKLPSLDFTKHRPASESST